MRKERWMAMALVAGAVWIGTLAGCGGGGSTDEGSSTTAGSDSTPAPSGTGTTPAGGATGEVSLAVGEKVVQERCVLCHGESGKGDGPGGAALNPKPRDWTDHTYMGSQTDDQLYQVIHDGKGSMPAWGKTGILTEAEIRSAILKVRTFDPQYTKS
jgi:mono/diheme cytochrome c family protein